MSGNRHLAGLSVDVDSVTSHLEGYGYPRSPADRPNPSCAIAVRRAVNLFDRLEVKATFFLIAEDARINPDVVRFIAGHGHEVACHSMSHPLPFSFADKTALRREITDSRKLLEDLAGQPVTGFRAPSWDLEPGVIETIIDSGYVYDASLFPSWMLMLLRRKVSKLGKHRARPLEAPWKQCFAGKPFPHRIHKPNGDIVEIPVCTVPVLRLPYYHTLRYLLSPAAFQWLRRGAFLRPRAINYILHAVDFLGLTEDGLDRRIERHPGMRLSIKQKLELAEASVRELKPRGAVVPLDTIARSFEDQQSSESETRQNLPGQILGQSDT